MLPPMFVKLPANRVIIHALRCLLMERGGGPATIIFIRVFGKVLPRIQHLRYVTCLLISVCRDLSGILGVKLGVPPRMRTP
jgi:hypothetical protein